ncbi:hypothetical protein FDK38_004741 [Candidozyma auris]|nr:hypothetical protein FDK38_004741 [[Candida] auris]
MSGFKHEDSGIAAAIFLALYTIYSAFMIYVLYNKGIKSIYTFLFTFALIRLGSQVCGVGFAIVGVENVDWLIAYLVLGAEGYFVLILCAFRFVSRAQETDFGHSWVLQEGPNIPCLQIITKTWARIFHYLLIPANVLVIAGGTMLTNVTDFDKEHDKVVTSKAMRTAGQAMFLSMTLMVVMLSVWSYKVDRVRNHFNVTVLLALPFLTVRGIFGVLSIFIKSMNYFQLSNYSANGINHKLVVYEYVLSTTMEFLASGCLMSNFFLEKRKKKIDYESSSDSIGKREVI